MHRSWQCVGNACGWATDCGLVGTLAFSRCVGHKENVRRNDNNKIRAEPAVVCLMCSDLCLDHHAALVTDGRSNLLPNFLEQISRQNQTGSGKSAAGMCDRCHRISTLWCFSFLVLPCKEPVRVDRASEFVGIGFQSVLHAHC